MRKESQGSCSVDDGNVFNDVLDDSDCRSNLCNCLKKLETKVTEIFDLANTANENQIKDARKLENLENAVDFIRKKFENYEAERQQKDEIIRSLRGKVSALVKRDIQEQYSRRNCFLIHGISENKVKILMTWL